MSEETKAEKVGAALGAAAGKVEDAAHSVVEAVKDAIPRLRKDEPLSEAYIVTVRDAIKSDGCSGVADLWVECCILHDLYWRTGKDEYGEDISLREANARFRSCMQRKSRLGRLSPVSWWRWAGVTLFGALTRRGKKPCP